MISSARMRTPCPRRVTAASAEAPAGPTGRRRRLRPALAVLALGSLCAGTVRAAPQTDVVQVVNGDRLTGEIKRLDRGLLRLKTDSLDTVEIIWEDVVAVTSGQQMQVETESGDRYFGPVESTDGEPGVLRVRQPTLPVELPMDVVVRITPIQSDFRQRLDGSLDVGLSVARANRSRDFSLSFRTSARTRKWLRVLEASSLVSEQEGAENTNRADASFTANRFLQERRFLFGRAQGSHNDQLGIDWRAVAGAGYGRYARQTNTSQLAWAAGMAVNEERLQAADGTDTSLEALLGLAYQFFRLHHPKIDINTSLIVYPSLSEGGRVRSEFKIQGRQEVVKDFYVGLNAYWSWDNEPPAAETETYDWAVTTSIGYSW